MDWVYLDNNATTRPAEPVVAAMQQMLLEEWANPSSIHRFGQQARQRMEQARGQLAALIGAEARELVFTSGGTESDGLALRGFLGPPASGESVLLTTRVEHAAVREPAADFEQAGGQVVWLPVDAAGRVPVEQVQEALAAALGPNRSVLLSVQWANNETGVFQPIAALAAAVALERERWRQRRLGRCKIGFHVDATQMVGKWPICLKDPASGGGIDLLTLAAHKFHGPKGVGALFCRTGVRLQPQQRGGAQERDRRGGTENVPGVVGMGVAAALAADFLAQPQRLKELAQLRDRFEAGILASVPDARINGLPEAADQRLWNTSSVAFPGLEAEAILLGLSERGICASAGAACSSGSLEPSPVLLAMGMPEPQAHGSVRFSLSRETRPEEIDHALAVIPQVVGRLARAMPTGGV